jgi:hypothetical protein
MLPVTAFALLIDGMSVVTGNSGRSGKTRPAPVRNPQGWHRPVARTPKQG